MPTLSDPRLSITVASGTPNATVTASCDVRFSDIEKLLIQLLQGKLHYRLTCRIRGADSGLLGPDNALFTLGNVDNIVGDRQNVTFTRTVNRDMLDEDSVGEDEVYARFWCTPPSGTGLPLEPAKTIDSREVHGSF